MTSVCLQSHLYNTLSPGSRRLSYVHCRYDSPDLFPQSSGDHFVPSEPPHSSKSPRSITFLSLSDQQTCPILVESVYRGVTEFSRLFMESWEEGKTSLLRLCVQDLIEVVGCRRR